MTDVPAGRREPCGSPAKATAPSREVRDAQTSNVGIVAAIVAGALVLAVGPVGVAAGGREPGGGGSGGFQREHDGSKDADNRKGRVAPSQR